MGEPQTDNYRLRCAACSLAEGPEQITWGSGSVDLRSTAETAVRTRLSHAQRVSVMKWASKTRLLTFETSFSNARQRTIYITLITYQYTRNTTYKISLININFQTTRTETVINKIGEWFIVNKTP